MTAWHSIPERGSQWGIRCGFTLLNLLGYWPARMILWLVIAYFFLTGKRSRQASLDYLKRLRRVYGETVPAGLRGAALQSLQAVLDYLPHH